VREYADRSSNLSCTKARILFNLPRQNEGEMEIGSGTGTAAIGLEMRDTAAHGTRLGMTETVGNK
jgi:hypothetical protein